jgi:hypothetical protein
MQLTCCSLANRNPSHIQNKEQDHKVFFISAVFWDRNKWIGKPTENVTWKKKEIQKMQSKHFSNGHSDIRTVHSGSIFIKWISWGPESSSSIFTVDMDMSYTRVLHIKVAYRVHHKWRHALYVTRPLLCARITCYVTVITHGRCYARA